MRSSGPGVVERKWDRLLWRLTLGLAAAYALFLLVEPLVQVYVVRPGSSVSAPAVLAASLEAIAGPLLMLLLPVSAAMAAAALAASRSTSQALLCVLLAMAVWPAHEASVAAAATVRIDGFERFAAKLEPLVQALTDEARRLGVPVERIEAAGPEVVGMAMAARPRACRDLEYRVLDRDARGEWQLSIDCGWRGWAQLDRFYYRSSGVYEDDIDTEQVGRWRYVWD